MKINITVCCQLLYCQFILWWYYIFFKYYHREINYTAILSNSSWNSLVTSIGVKSQALQLRNHFLYWYFITNNIYSNTDLSPSLKYLLNFFCTSEQNYYTIAFIKKPVSYLKTYFPLGKEIFQLLISLNVIQLCCIRPHFTCFKEVFSNDWKLIASSFPMKRLIVEVQFWNLFNKRILFWIHLNLWLFIGNLLHLESF